jgi:hypothetical protein
MWRRRLWRLRLRRLRLRRLKVEYLCDAQRVNNHHDLVVDNEGNGSGENPRDFSEFVYPENPELVNPSPALLCE